MLGLEPRTYPLSYYYSKRNILNKITYEKVEVLRTLILFIFSVTQSGHCIYARKCTSRYLCEHYISTQVTSPIHP